jgi:hypothetical protein
MNGTDTFLNSIEQDYSGYAMAQGESLEMLNKALEAGSGVDASGFTGGRALIPESLDNTLVNILWNQDEAVLFQRLKKQPIKSPVHQWDVRDEVGANDGAWVPEGGNSEEADQTIARKFETAKYLQTLRKVTLQASISNMIENAMVLEQNAGTLWIIRNVETSLFYGNDDYVAEQPNGLNSQIPATNILDLRGASADSATFENTVNEAQRIIRENFGKGSLMLMSPKNMEDFQRLLRDRIRVSPAEGGMGAYVFDRYPTTFGTLELREDIFIQEGAAPSASTLTSKVPGKPSVALAASGSGSQFTAGDAGTYSYKIVAVNRYGDSEASDAATQAVAAGEEVTLTVTYGSGATPSAFKVYRQDPGQSSHLYAFTVTAPADGGTITDTNAYLPGTSDVYILTMGQMYDAIEWFQFLPLMKFDLYPTNAAVYPFLMLLFGALALKKPVQHIRIKNVAPSSLGWY